MDNDLKKLNQASLKLLTPLPLDRMCKTIVEEARKLVDAEYGSVFLAQSGTLQRVYSSSDVFYKIHIKQSGYVYKSFRNRKAYSINIRKIEKTYPEIKALGITHLMMIPLSYKNDCVGVLVIQRKKEAEFRKNEIHTLRLFGSMATLAIKKTQHYQEATKALELRDVFLSLASHELRTPLTSITGYIQLLHRRLGNKNTQEAGWVRELEAESMRLTRLVKELLEVNRIKAGQLQYNLTPSRLGSIVQQAIGRFAFTHPERKIVFEDLCGSEDTVIADTDKILQVVSSIINNAVKFSPSGSAISVVLTLEKPYLVLRVSDKGVGIADEDVAKILQGFYKPADNLQEGMGVGLLLSRHILQFHHGTLSILSKEKEGTTIVVKIPHIRL